MNTPLDITNEILRNRIKELKVEFEKTKDKEKKGEIFLLSQVYVTVLMDLNPNGKKEK